MRVLNHPILGETDTEGKTVQITIDGKTVMAVEGEPVASALMAEGMRTFRKTPIYHKPRGLFCAIGRCTDCAMTVDGVPNVRTCITRVREGMTITTQDGLGRWGEM